MGRIDGNPTPISQEEQTLDPHVEEECDYEPVTTDQASYHADQQEKPPQKLHQQSPHHQHPQTVPQAFPPPPQQGGFQSPQPSPPPQGQPQAFPPPPQQGGFQSPQPYPPPQGQPQAFPPHSYHGNYGQAQAAQPQAFPPQVVQYPAQPSNQYNQPLPQQHNVQASPMPVPMGVPQYPQYTEGWKTGLFDCFEDPANTLVTACFPCVTFGQIAEIIDNGQTPCATSGLLYGLIAFFIGIPCIMSCTYRTKLRNRFGLIESPAPDWITHCCCEWCALCQEYRELQIRGLDPSIGWQGNVAKNQNLQQQQVAMVAPNNQTMMA